MRFFRTWRFLGLIAYSVLIFWMIFYGDMASKILGTGAACAMTIIMAYRIEELEAYIFKLEKNIEKGKFGSDEKPDDPDDHPICLDNDDEDNLFRRSNLKEVKKDG